jgi:hypothetical protein
MVQGWSISVKHEMEWYETKMKLKSLALKTIWCQLLSIVKVLNEIRYFLAISFNQESIF